MKKTISLALIMAFSFAGGCARTDFAFGTPMNLGPTVNTPSAEAGPSISADGLALYFKSDRPGGFGKSDLYVSTRTTKEEPWGASSNLGPVVNSSAEEGVPSISADGLTLYFMSERPGGEGKRDIWVTTRATKDEAWPTPVNVGPPVNTPHEECCPNISADGLSLLFFSNRPGGSGGRDLWVTTRPTKHDDWTSPTNLGPIVNSSADEGSPSISADGLLLFFFSDRSGDRDLWVTTRTKVSEPWGKPANLGPKVNTSDEDGGPDLSKDGRTLYFSSDRPDGEGGRDLWQVSISTIVDPNAVGTGPK